MKEHKESSLGGRRLFGNGGDEGSENIFGAINFLPIINQVSKKQDPHSPIAKKPSAGSFVQTQLPFQQHWSRRTAVPETPLLFASPQSQMVVPLTKVRRTMSEVVGVEDLFIKGPLGGSMSLNSYNLGEVCQLPCHESPRDAIKRITPATVIS